MTQRITPALWGMIAGLALIWGASFLSVRITLDEVPPLTTAAHRILWAAVALWLVMALRGETLPRGWRIWGIFAVMGFLNNTVPFTFLAWGQQHIEVGLTAIINASTAIWGVLIASLAFADERLTLPRVAGVTLGFLGVATAIGLDAFASFDLRSLAQLAVIGATIGYALAGSWGRAMLKGVSPLSASTGMLTMAAAFSVPVALSAEGAPDLTLAPITWVSLAFNSLVSTAAAYLIYYAILRRTGAGNLLLVTLLVAPVAIVLGALLRDEALSASAFAGFALLAFGLLVLDGRLMPRRAPAD